MALWRVFYHFVWSTKERKPLIKLNIEPQLYHYIIGKADALNCITHAINGTKNHIHLVVSIPPTLAISDFVKKIKGSSSHYLNNVLSLKENKFAWQAGYGVFSLGQTQLEQAIAYVVDQKQHHSKGTVNFYRKIGFKASPISGRLFS